MESWYVIATGNMTLSVLSNLHEEQILRVDLLSSRTLIADDNSQKLARTWNDLYLLAIIPNLLVNQQFKIQLKDPDAGISPFPWQINVQLDKHSFVIRDQARKEITRRVFPKRMHEQRLHEILKMLTDGITLLNQMLSIDS